MQMYNTIKTIRYMGNKNKLLDFIIPEIINNSSKDDIICELMAGTNCVSYALKDKRKIYTNDIQYYSYIISNALIKNNSKVISSENAIKDLEEKYKINLESHEYDFFKKNYSDTYFSASTRTSSFASCPLIYSASCSRPFSLAIVALVLLFCLYGL